LSFRFSNAGSKGIVQPQQGIGERSRDEEAATEITAQQARGHTVVELASRKIKLRSTRIEPPFV
jgi:hypothetical protein